MELQQSIKAHTGRIWYADWSPDGELLATCGADKCILIWKSECNAWVNIDKLDGSHTKSVRKVKWSRTGDHLASASFDGTVVIWKKKPGQMEGMLTLEGHENEVKDISWSHEDKYLATCGRDKTIWIWETDIDYEYITIAVLTRHTQDIKCVEFHPTNDILCSGSYDNSIILWEGHGDDWVSKDILLSHESTVWDIKWLGNNLVSVSDDLTLKYWVLEADDKYHLHKTISGVHSRTIYSVDIHQNFICTAGGDDSIVIYNQNFEILSKFENAHSMDINCVKFNPVQCLIVSVSDDGFIKIWRNCITGDIDMNED